MSGSLVPRHTHMHRTEGLGTRLGKQVLGGEKGGSSVHLTDRYTWRSVIKHAKHTRLRGVGACPPPRKFLISDLLRSFLVPF